MMTLARYPNMGFGHIDRIVDKGAVYDSKTINETVYFNTGRLLLESGGMLHGTHE